MKPLTWNRMLLFNVFLQTYSTYCQVCNVLVTEMVCLKTNFEQLLLERTL